MARRLPALILFALPLVELLVLVWTARTIGLWATLGIIVATGMIGIAVLVRQQLTVVRRMMEAVNEGRPPIAPVVDGAFKVLAGGLLFSPGLLCDLAGALLLIAPLRHAVARWSVHRLLGGAEVHTGGYDEGEPRPSDGGMAQGPVIDGEFERLDERPADRGRHGASKR